MKNKTFWESVKCAIKGQIYGYKTEKNFRTYTFIVIFFTIINILLKVHPLAYLYLIVSGLGAFSLECINTAIEHLCNLITEKYDEKIKNIVDKIIIYGIMKKQSINGLLVKRLTHMPFTHAFMGSNPVRVTI